MKTISLLTLSIAFAFIVGVEAAENSVLRVGHFPNITRAQALVKHNLSRQGKGWFEERLGPGTKMEWFVYNAGPSAMEAIFAQSIDLTYVGPGPALNAYPKSNGAEVRLIAGAANGGAALVVQPDQNLKTPADFRGKKIATPQLGNTQDISCRAWLTAGGLKITQLGGEAQVLPTQNPDQLALFKERLEVAKFFLQLFGLEKFSAAHVHELSGGMKQRVALARALAPNPRVLLMDEPFAALDALTREQLYSGIQRIWQKRRKTIVFVTHNVREAVCLADRVMLFSRNPGRMIGIAIGLPLGLFTSASKFMEDTVGVLALGLQTLPSVCWIPLALLWFGQTESAMLFVVIMGTVWSVVIATDTGVRNIPPIYARAALTMGSSGLHKWTKVILPASLPYLVSGMKQGWAFAWRSLMAAEMYVTILTGFGLGHLLHYGRELHAMDRVIGVMLVIVLIGLLTDKILFAPIERFLHRRWGTGLR